MSREDTSAESPQKGHRSQIEWDKPKKGHTKSNPMWRGPNHNGIIESWVDSNQYYWKCLSSESIWIEILESHLSRESIWIKFQKEFRVMSWFESILESHVSHELSQNQNFLRLSWIKSKKWAIPMSIHGFHFFSKGNRMTPYLGHQLALGKPGWGPESWLRPLTRGANILGIVVHGPFLYTGMPISQLDIYSTIVTRKP